MRPDLTTHGVMQLLKQGRGRLLAGLERDKSVDPLPFEVVRHTDYGSLGDRRMPAQGSLHLRRAQAMAGDVNHVIHPAGDPIVAVLVSAAAISSEVHTRVERKVGLDEALVIAIDGPHHPWPGKLETQVAGNTVPAQL